MPPMKIDFGTQSNPGRHGPDTGPRHINAYVESVVEGGAPIYVPSGLRLLATVSEGGACRGLISINDVFYAVSGKKLVKVDQFGSVTDIGSIPGTTSVFMARNANRENLQIAVVVEGLRYVIDDDVLTPISDTDLPPPESVAFLDQRLMYSMPDGRIFWSEIDDATDIDALSFATAEGAPDGLTRVYAHRLDAWLFGKETIEIWAATANETNPFQRRPGGFIQSGCIAHHSVASLGDDIFWIGHDCIPRRAAGYSQVLLQHFPVCRAIENTTDKDGIVGFGYYDRGHAFYVISGADWTWQYNRTTDRWFERESNQLTRWRAHHATRFRDQTVVGDSQNANIYVVDPTYHTENSEVLTWTIQSPPVHARPNRISVDRLHVNVVTGVGLNSSDTHASAPKLGLRYSDDGGHSWTRKRLESLGAIGQRKTRVSFNGLGTTGHQGRIWELSSSSPVVRGLIDTEIEGGLVTV